VRFIKNIFLLIYIKNEKYLNTVSLTIRMYKKRNNELEIIMLFSKNYNQRHYLREISRLTKLPLKTTQTSLKQLENKRILLGQQEGKNKYFKLNLNNIQTKFYLLQAEIHKTQLFLEKYTFFKTFLKGTFPTSCLIIFGSYAKFIANKDSDIDMMIISKKDVKLPIHLLPFKSHKIKLSKPQFIKSLKQQETLIKEIEENHVILNDHSFYVNEMWGYYAK